MKKFLGVFIAVLIVASLFATTAVAFAEEQTYALNYAVGDNGEGTAPAEAKYAKDVEITVKAFRDSSLSFKPKKGFEFDHWTDGENTYKAGDKFNMPEHDVTLTAVWKTVHEVIVDNDALKSALSLDDGFDSLKIEMGDFKFGVKMMEKENAATVRNIFSGIKYVHNDEEETDDNKKADNDKIYVEYCRPSESPKGQETWQNSSLITSSIRLSSSGWYLFRIVVKDSTGVNVLAESEKFSRYTEDTTNPVVDLSSAMKDKVTSGLVEGTKYTPSTSLSITDSSSTTVTYKIYKFVNGNWTTDPIYDSATKEIAEDYKDYVDENGAITPSKGDISADPVYKIVYSVVDANGYYGVKSEESSEKFEPEMLLFVKAAPVEKNKAANVWQIVLFCIAGACAIGIVVLLCIKPKQPAPARTSSAEKEITEESSEE